MSDRMTLKSAKALYEDVLCHERGGCTTNCLSKDVWFTTSNSGADRRYPSVAMARFIKRSSGYTEEEMLEASDFNEDEEDDVFPVLTRTHPLTVDWSGTTPRSYLPWSVLCPDLYSVTTMDSSGTEDTTSTKSFNGNEMGTFQEDMR